MIDIRTEMKLIVDSREEGEPDGEYNEFNIGAGIDITTSEGHSYCGDITEIKEDCVIIDDADRNCSSTIMFKDIACIWEY